jgi:hypothetical protein
MGDHRQHNAFVRVARPGDRLLTAQFTHNRGFAAANDPTTEVCLVAGTELVFDRHIECEPTGPHAAPKKIRRKRAWFSQMPLRHSNADALKFRDEFVLPVKRLRLGQYATVRKLPFIPASARTDARRQASRPRS